MLATAPVTRSAPVRPSCEAPAAPAPTGPPLVADVVALRRWAARRGVVLPATARVDRTEHVPGRRLRAAVDPGDGGPWWLLTSYAPLTWPAAAGDLRSGRRHGAVAADAERLTTLVPAASDRALRRPVRHAGTSAADRWLGYVPGTRAVLRRWDVVLTLCADPAVPQRAAAAAALLRAHGVSTPAVLPSPSGVLTQAWVPVGGAPVTGDEAADVLDRLAATPGTGLPVLAPAALLAAGRAALAALPGDPGLPDEERSRVRALLRDWPGAVDPGTAHALAPRVVTHGRFTAERLVRGEGGATLLGVDALALGPAGWDAATWAAGEAAAGRRWRLPGGASPHPAVAALAAALLLPAVARHADRGRRVRALLDVVEELGP